MQPITDQRNELKLLKARVEAAERELVQLRRRQLPLSEPPRSLRLVQTSSDSTYPNHATYGDPNTFQYKGLERTFTKTQGLQSTSEKLRSATQQGVGHVLNGGFIKNGTPCLALEQPNGHTILLPQPRRKLYGFVADSVVVGRDPNSNELVEQVNIYKCTVLDIDGDTNYELWPTFGTEQIVNAWHIGGVPLNQNQWVTYHLDDDSGEYVCEPIVGQVANKGIVARLSSAPLSITGSATIPLTTTSGYETSSNLPIYLSGSPQSLTFRSCHVKQFAGVRYWWFAELTASVAQHASNWLEEFVTIASPSSVGTVTSSFPFVVPPKNTQITIPAQAGLVDSGGDTLTVPSQNVNVPFTFSGDAVDFEFSLAGGGYYVAQTGPTSIPLTVNRSSSAVTAQIDALIVLAEIYGIGDGYN